MDEKLDRREFCGSLAAALVGVGGVAALVQPAPAAKVAPAFLAPVLRLTDRAGNVIGYANNDFCKTGSSVRANGKVIAGADLRGEWITAHHVTVVGA